MEKLIKTLQDHGFTVETPEPGILLVKNTAYLPAGNNETIWFDEFLSENQDGGIQCKEITQGNGFVSGITNYKSITDYLRY